MKTTVFASTLLLLMSGASFAEDSCIRSGTSQIILTELANCKAGFIASQSESEWKYAIVDRGNDDDDTDLGCWRKDDVFVYVQINGETTTSLVTKMMDAKFCSPPEARLRDRRWESEIEQCEDLYSPKKTARIACNRAMKIAESFGEADPRFVRTLDGLSVQSEDNAEIEALTRRSLEIRKKHFSGDYVALVSTIASFGYLRQRQVDWEASIPFYLEAIELGNKHLGKENLTVVVNTMLFGKLYLDHGRLPEAKKWLLQALEGAENNNTSHWATASHVASSSARFLADVFRAEGDIAEADRYTEIQRKYKQYPRSRQRESDAVYIGDTEVS